MDLSGYDYPDEKIANFDSVELLFRQNIFIFVLVFNSALLPKPSISMAGVLQETLFGLACGLTYEHDGFCGP